MEGNWITVEISIYLFGKPSWEMNIEGGKATPQMLREKGDELKVRLYGAADVLEKLLKNGWTLAEAYGTLYVLQLYKNVTLEEAREELKKLGIDPEEYYLDEMEEEIAH